MPPAKGNKNGHIPPDKTKNYNISSGNEEIQWAATSLTRGKIVACPSELGMVFLGRADKKNGVIEHLAKICKKQTDFASWTICCSSLNSAWSYWQESDQKQDGILQRMLNILWPGPLVVNALASQKALALNILHGSRKVGVWIPSNPLLRSLVKSVNCPLIMGKLPLKTPFETPTEEELIERCSQEADLVLKGPTPPGRLTETILDVSSVDYRLLKIGNISTKEIQRLCPKRIILSNDIPDLVVDDSSSLAKLVLFEGDPERIARRLKQFVQDNKEQSSSIVFLLNTPNLRDLLTKEFNLKNSFDFALPPKKSCDLSKEVVKESQENCQEKQQENEDELRKYWKAFRKDLLEKIEHYTHLQDVSWIVVEGVERSSHTEEFMDKISRMAHTVVNIEPLYAVDREVKIKKLPDKANSCP